MRALSLPVVVATLVTASAPAVAAPEKLWELGGLREPESVLPDTAAGVLYVSNVGAIPPRALCS